MNINLHNVSPKLFAGVAIVGTVTTTVLAIRQTPKAMRLIEEAGAVTRKERADAAWKCFLPVGASMVITIAAIVANHSVLMRQNVQLASAYILGQTALRLYSERSSAETRNQVSAEVMRMQEPPAKKVMAPIEPEHAKKVLIPIEPECDPKDRVNDYFDYYSGRYFHASMNQVTNAIDEFNEKIVKEYGRGSLNQLYECFHNPDELPRVGFADFIGWKHVNGQGAVPMITSELDKYGNTKIILDFFNPPQADWNNEFA